MNSPLNLKTKITAVTSKPVFTMLLSEAVTKEKDLLIVSIWKSGQKSLAEGAE